jgi:hypothetical protein
MNFHGARLKGWQRTESDGGALQMPYVPNGMKRHKSSKSKCMNLHNGMVSKCFTHCSHLLKNLFGV